MVENGRKTRGLFHDKDLYTKELFSQSRQSNFYISIIVSKDLEKRSFMRLFSQRWATVDQIGSGTDWAESPNQKESQFFTKTEKGYFCLKLYVDSISVYSATVSKKSCWAERMDIWKHTSSKAKLETIPNTVIMSTTVKFHVHGISRVTNVLLDEPPA